ncbi:helix-turn-helix domain-containing protein [Kocuria rhizophila]|uniref:ArsR/SmtB family transcription factor n=1 Tax=Kocuria rhizophila TaxID=72000 RepID=UPI0009E3B04E
MNRSHARPAPAEPVSSLTEVLSALGNPVRLAVVVEVATRGPLSPGEIQVGVAASTLSRHLGVLRRAGIIRQETVGLRRPCHLRRKELSAGFPGLLDCVLELAEGSH